MEQKMNKPKAPSQMIELPSAIDSECLVLGTIIVYESSVFDNNTQELIKPECFSDYKNKAVYHAILELKEAGTKIDLITTTNQLTKDGYNYQESASVVADLMSKANISSFAHHVNIICQINTSIELIKLATELQTSAVNGLESPVHLMDSFIGRIDDLRASIKTTADLIRQPTRTELFDHMRKKSNGIETPYWVINEAKTNRSPIVLPSGALSFFCAPTSHGKSTMLRNLAWYIVQNISGDILYFTFEESADALVGQFTNLALNENLNIYKKLSEGGEYKINNKQAIDAYFSGELSNGNYIGDPCNENALTLEIEKIIRADKEFSGYYCADMQSPNGNKFYIINEDISARQLASLVENHYNRIRRQGRKISAIMIDYIQLIAIDEDAKKDTTCYALKKACDRLRAFSIKTDLPVVCAAQLKNDVESPLTMRAELIADSSDIGKAANLIVCMWNSIVPARNELYYGFNSNGNKVEAKGKHLTDIGFYAGGISKYGGMGFLEQDVKKHKIYMKVVKRRGDERNVEGVYDFNGNTGVIVPNEANLYPKETKPAFDPF